jgi:hypothetical protein
MFFESILLSPNPLMIVYWDCHESEAMAIPFINFTYEISEYASNVTLYVHTFWILFIYCVLWSSMNQDLKAHEIIAANILEIIPCAQENITPRGTYRFMYCTTIFTEGLPVCLKYTEFRNWKLFNTEKGKKDINLRATDRTPYVIWIIRTWCMYYAIKKVKLSL